MSLPWSHSVLVLALLWPAAASAELHWRADFESGDLSGWSYLLNERGLSISSEVAEQGRHALRVQIQGGEGYMWPGGLNRVEVKHAPAPARTAEGAETYFAFSFYLPRPLAEGFHEIAYWESENSWSQQVALDLDGSTLSLVTRGSGEEHWRGEVTPGHWHRVVMGLRWSRDPALGRVQLWFDGVQVVRDGVDRTLADDNPMFVQMGLLRHDASLPPEEIFFDDVREADRFEDLDEGQFPAASGPDAGAPEVLATAARPGAHCTLRAGRQAGLRPPGWLLLGLALGWFGRAASRRHG